MALRLEQTTLAGKLRANQQFGTILLLDNGADSNYHSLQTSIHKRFDQAGLLTAGHNSNLLINDFQNALDWSLGGPQWAPRQGPP